MKKIIALLLALALCIALASCGGAGGDGGGTTAPDTPAGNTPTAPADTGGSSDETGVIKVGHLVCLSGWFAAIDKPNVDEITAFAAYINDDLGGWDIGGKKYKVEIVTSDFQSDPSQARAAVEYLSDQGVEYALESVDILTRGIGDLWEELEIMHIDQLPNDPTFTGPQYPHMFFSQGGSWTGYDAGLQALKKAFPDVQKVVYCEDDTGSNSIIFNERVIPAAEKLGIEVYPEMILFSSDQTDFSAVALSLQKTDADAWIASGPPTNHGGLTRELRTLGDDMIDVSCNTQSVVTLSMIAGGAGGFVSLFSLPGSPGLTQIYNDTHAKYMEMYGDEVAQTFDALATNSLYILLQMMSIAGTTEKNAVMATWEAQDTIDTFFGPAPICGEESMGSKRAVASPHGVSYMTHDGETGFKGYVDTFIP